jgi:hypothetical protein
MFLPIRNRYDTFGLPHSTHNGDKCIIHPGFSHEPHPSSMVDTLHILGFKTLSEIKNPSKIPTSAVLSLYYPLKDFYRG